MSGKVQHRWRGIGGAVIEGALTPRKAIRAHCVECMQSKAEPRECTGTLCALYPFRPGQRVGGRDMTEEEKEVARERLAEMRRRRG